MIDRLKSPVVWVSIIAQVCLIIAMFNPELAENVKTTAAAIVEIATLIGVLNNPTTRESF